MGKSKKGSLSIARVGADGRLTIPAEYRRALSLSRDAAVALVQVGETLVIAPCDDTFSALTQRLEARMHAAGSDVEDLVAATTEARAQIVREEFGVGDDE
jgi:bifunctional DNA-binding transcriptional regulator/antitoxin component of YhaV-PrlF toxin-antitoxin module